MFVSVRGARPQGKAYLRGCADGVAFQVTHVIRLGGHVSAGVVWGAQLLGAVGKVALRASGAELAPRLDPVVAQARLEPGECARRCGGPPCEKMTAQAQLS